MPTAAAFTARIAASVLALCALGLLAAAWNLADGFWWIKAFVIAVVGLAAIRPPDALLVVAGLSPVIGLFGAAQHAPYSLRDLLVLCAVAGWSIRGATRRFDQPLVPVDLAAPLVCLTLVVLTSFAVEQWGQRVLLGPAEYCEVIGEALRKGLLIDRHGIRGLNATAYLLEGLIVFAAAAAASARQRGFAARLVVMTFAGAAGAGLVNVLRVATPTIYSTAPLVRLRELLTTVRVSAHFADVNAAGSYFAMMFFPGAALTMTAARRLRAVWLVCSMVVFAAAWLTASRAAIGAILIVSAGMLGLRLIRGRVRSTRRVLAAVAACAILAALFISTFPNRVYGPSLATALEVRNELNRISLRMVAAQPAFGVGVGAYYDSSAPLLATSTIGKYYPRENAHNNFLHLFAELGTVGFGILVWLWWRVGRRILSAPGGLSHGAAAGAAAGLLAFALTALMGHPLLTPEVSQPFWLMLGIAAGLSPALGPSNRLLKNATKGEGCVLQQPASRPARAAIVGFIVLMLAVLPWRFRKEAEGLNLENVRYGVSRWSAEPDGVRYQTFNSQATLFIPGNVAAARIPVKEDSATTNSRLQVYLDGRLVNEVTTSREWRPVTIVISRATARSDFVRVDLVPVPLGPGEHRELKVGRVEASSAPSTR